MAKSARSVRGSTRASLLLLGAALLRRRLLLRHFRAGAPRLGEADGDGLLAALDLLARASALQRAAFPLVHRLFDLLRRFLAVLRRHACNLLHNGMCKWRARRHPDR